MNGQAFYRHTAGAIANYLAQELKLTLGIHYRFTDASSGPRILALSLQVNPRYAQKIMAMEKELSMAAGLDKEQLIRVDRGRGGSICMEIPKPGGIDDLGRPYGLWYNVPFSSLPRRRFLLASLGFTDDFEPIGINFANAITPHMLIAGATGSGKTNAQRLIIYDLALQNRPDEVQFILIDTRKRGAGWSPFAAIPHLIHPIITDDVSAGKALAWATAEIDRRSVQRRSTPRVFIGIDEAQAVLENEALAKSVVDISGTGREFGIHLIAATQNPTAKLLGDAALKRNLSGRLVGRVDTATAAVVATGQEGTGAHKLTGAGDMLLVTPGSTRRLTSVLLTERDTGQLPRASQAEFIDLAPYEDISHVSDVANLAGKAGRPLDDIDFHLVGRLIAHMMQEATLADGTLGNRLGVNARKVTRYRPAAVQVLSGMRDEIMKLRSARSGTI